MVNTDQGLADGQRVGLGEGDSHQKGSDQPWPPGNGQAVDLLHRAPRLFEGHGHDAVYPLDVLPGGQFGNHSPEVSVQLDLGVDRVRKDSLTILHDGGGGFVAGRFDSQNLHLFSLPSRV